jgi:hypothetical protein
MTTMSAIEDRVRRKLKQEGQSLRKTRGKRMQQECGDYYIFDDRKHIVAKHLDLMNLAKELGVFRPGEKVQ